MDLRKNGKKLAEEFPQKLVRNMSHGLIFEEKTQQHKHNPHGVIQGPVQPQPGIMYNADE